MNSEIKRRNLLPCIASVGVAAALIASSDEASSQSRSADRGVGSFNSRGGDWVSVKEYGAVGDGVTDDSAALYNATASGKPVYFPAGTYVLNNATILSPSTGQKFFGIPGKSIIKKSTLTNGGAILQHLHPTFDIVDVTDVTIDGLTLSLNILTLGATEFGFMLRATALGNTNRIRIQNCNFINCNNYIERYVYNVFIDRNIFLGNSVAEGGVNTGGQYGVNVDGICQYIFITNNYFSLCVSEAIDINWDTRNVVIANNIFDDCCITAGNEVVDIGGGTSSFCKNITVTGNVFNNVNFPANGVNVKLTSSDVSITGNTFICTASTTAGDKGVITNSNVSNVVIADNTFRGYTYGVYSTANISTNVNLSITGNTILDCGTTGVFCVNASSKTLISNNMIYTTIATTPTNGIDLSSLTDFLVCGNYINGFLSFGIAVAASCSEGVISDNLMASCSTGIRVLGPRIKICDNIARNCKIIGMQFQGTHLTINDNQAYNNSQVTPDQYGFSFAAGCDYAVITGNKSYDTQGGSATQNGFTFGASDRVIFNNNIAYPVKTTALNGNGTLTNSLVGTAGNIIA